ncbi:HEPN domain-containing protein [Gillisia sp. Hel_I_86]|uniref:HEPN domain-containing protein n=1 Tax=Gillisia sp. Hel_I_86 TaxID=1249981 RepID=UPI00119A753F|nr:HEPN domain-containing protein [Gillisia sp. Hel_I_86]TVZ27510.1 HEPN domain-containing protein [Gillisia sp. Hel_I_86]
MEQEANRLFDDGREKLNEANNELYKPKEDVVSYLVCKNAQHVIENYLKGFLLQKGIDPTNYKTIDSLYQQCKTINKNFEKVELSHMECNSELRNSKSCNEVSKVSKCFEAASNLDTFFKQEKIIS